MKAYKYLLMIWGLLCGSTAFVSAQTSSGIVDVYPDPKHAVQYIKRIVVTDTGRPEGTLLFDITNGNAVFLVPLGVGIPDPSVLFHVKESVRSTKDIWVQKNIGVGKDPLVPLDVKTDAHVSDMLTVDKLGIKKDPTVSLEVDGTVLFEGVPSNEESDTILWFDSSSMLAKGKVTWKKKGDNIYFALPGNVWVGVENPSAKLDINGTIRGATQITIPGQLATNQYAKDEFEKVKKTAMDKLAEKEKQAQEKIKKIKELEQQIQSLDGEIQVLDQQIATARSCSRPTCPCP